MGFIEELRSYAAAAAGAGWAAKLRGARSEDVGELEDLTGLVLPPAYRSFLEAMGEDAGGLSLHPDGPTPFSEILALYRELDSRPEFRPPTGHLIVAMGSLTDLALDLSEPGRAPVVELDGRAVAGLASPSFEELCFSRAFWLWRFERFKDGVCEKVAAGADPVRAAMDAARVHGFSVEPFGLPVRGYAWRADAAVAAWPAEPGEAYVAVRAGSFAEPPRLLKTIAASMAGGSAGR